MVCDVRAGNPARRKAPAGGRGYHSGKGWENDAMGAEETSAVGYRACGQ